MSYHNNKKKYLEDSLKGAAERAKELRNSIELLESRNRELNRTIAMLSDRASARHDQLAVIQLALEWCNAFGVDSDKESRENCVGAYVAGYGIGAEDSRRLEWILKNYSLSCGITRSEIDDKMKELGELRA